MAIFLLVVAKVGDDLMSVQKLTKLAILLGLTLTVQMLGLPQPVTGPAVNGMLILSTLAIGPLGAALIGMLTPVLAFTRGILALPLGPAIPFIIAANWAYVLIFAGLQKVNKIVALGVGAVVKFLVLAVAVRFFLAVPPPVAKALQLPQLFTAVLGGLVALFVWKALVKTGWQRGDD